MDKTIDDIGINEITLTPCEILEQYSKQKNHGPR